MLIGEGFLFLFFSLFHLFSGLPLVGFPRRSALALMDRRADGRMDGWTEKWTSECSGRTSVTKWMKRTNECDEVDEMTTEMNGLEMDIPQLHTKKTPLCFSLAGFGCEGEAMVSWPLFFLLSPSFCPLLLGPGLLFPHPLPLCLYFIFSSSSSSSFLSYLVSLFVSFSSDVARLTCR